MSKKRKRVGYISQIGDYVMTDSKVKEKKEHFKIPPTVKDALDQYYRNFNLQSTVKWNKDADRQNILDAAKSCGVKVGWIAGTHYLDIPYYDYVVCVTVRCGDDLNYYNDKEITIHAKPVSTDEKIEQPDSVTIKGNRFDNIL